MLCVDDGSSGPELARAGDALARCQASVLLGGVVRIRPEATRLVCVVRDPDAAHRCAMEFEVLIENARRTLQASRLYAHLPARRLEWIIQEGP